MSMNCVDAAEEQFKSALQVDLFLFHVSWQQTFSKLTEVFLQKRASHSDLATFINLNLAIVYLRMNRTQDLEVLLSTIDPEHIPAQWDTLFFLTSKNKKDWEDYVFDLFLFQFSQSARVCVLRERFASVLPSKIQRLKVSRSFILRPTIPCYQSKPWIHVIYDVTGSTCARRSRWRTRKTWTVWRHARSCCLATFSSTSEIAK